MWPFIKVMCGIATFYLPFLYSRFAGAKQLFFSYVINYFTVGFVHLKRYNGFWRFENSKKIEFFWSIFRLAPNFCVYKRKINMCFRL